jgi:hypothetical protein
MPKTTPLHKRIIPSFVIFKTVLRSLLYMRSVFLSLLGVLLINSTILFMFERNLPMRDGVRPVINLTEAFYLGLATAASINTGDISAVSPMGHFLLLVDAFIGIIFLGLIVWVIQFCLEETALKESKFFFFATNKDAKLK